MNNLEFAKVMQKRTKVFAVQVVKFFGTLPKSEEARILGRQFLRAGTSVASNYRAVCRAKSSADFVSKMNTVVEEADESLFWLELMEEAAVCPASVLTPLRKEAEALLRVFSSSLDTAKRNRKSVSQ